MKHEVSFGLEKNKSQPCIKRTQFPLALSWTCTVRKMQSLSLDEGVTSFDLHRQRSFNQGQMYVALSRITSLDRMFLIGNYNKAAIKENSPAKQEYQRNDIKHYITKYAIFKKTLQRYYERSPFVRQ